MKVKVLELKEKGWNCLPPTPWVFLQKRYSVTIKIKKSVPLIFFFLLKTDDNLKYSFQETGWQKILRRFVVGAIKPIDNSRILSLWGMLRVVVFWRVFSWYLIYLTLGENHPKLPTARSSARVRIEPGTSTITISQCSDRRAGVSNPWHAGLMRPKTSSSVAQWRKSIQFFILFQRQIFINWNRIFTCEILHLI